MLVLIAVAGAFLALGGLLRPFLFPAPSPDASEPLERQGANAPFVTSPDFIVDQMVQSARLSPNDMVYDLGCGDGRIVITAAMQSGCRGVGFDLKPARVEEARQNAELHGVADRVTIKQQDIFKVDLSEADAVLAYLLPWMMNELVPQFDQMRPGCRIVSHDYWIDGIALADHVEFPASGTENAHSIYVYETPLKRDPSLEPGKPPRIIGREVE